MSDIPFMECPLCGKNFNQSFVCEHDEHDLAGRIEELKTKLARVKALSIYRSVSGEEIKEALEKMMSECTAHEKLRRQGSPCPYCRIEELKSLLQRYGSHDLECNRNRSPIRKASHPEGLLRRPCSCGFDQALNQLEESS